MDRRPRLGVRGTRTPDPNPASGEGAAPGLIQMASTALPAADLIPVSPKANLAYRLVRFIGIPLLRLCFRFQVEGREYIPRSGHYVVIANHLNWLAELRSF